MPQATFVLKEPNSKDATLVYLLFSFNGSRLKYSTGQKLNLSSGIKKNRGLKMFEHSRNLQALIFFSIHLKQTLIIVTENFY